MSGPTADDLREILALSRLADDILEGCLRERLCLRDALGRLLAQTGQHLGATGAAVTTRDEELSQAGYTWGELRGDDAWTLLEGRSHGVFEVGQARLVSQPLDVAGDQVGVIGYLFEPPSPVSDEQLVARVQAVAEELDAILATVHTAAEKQELIVRINRALSNRVFVVGLDEAVAILHGTVPFAELAVVWRNVTEGSALEYRIYRGPQLSHDSESARHPGLDQAIEAHGFDLLHPAKHRLRAALEMDACAETVLVSGLTQADWLGTVLIRPNPGGFSAIALDLVRLMAEKARDRLLDFNRERRNLARFFPPRVVNRLLREPGYERHLAPREEQVAILYADLNGFTRLSELVFERPGDIAAFVDRWSQGAMDALWRHGGAFDKMVGDCVIGLFGPPFYDTPPERRALAALKAGREILEFTMRFEEDPAAAPIRAKPGVVPGLGVAVGVNLCPAKVGLFGPHQDFTAFSSGMNATARLQSLAGYREILAMESVVEAVSGLPEAVSFSFGPFVEAPVKNVSRPLRFARVGKR